MAVCKSKLSFDLLETRDSSYFFFGTYCVLSGEGIVTLEFIFYRGKIDNLSRIYLRGRYK